MDGIFQLGKLADWYGSLLTPRQLSFVRQYADEDCSLGEIAEREGVSRQAVRDAIVRAEEQMRTLESKLRLVERDSRMLDILADLRKKTGVPALLADLDRLRGMLEDNDGV